MRYKSLIIHLIRCLNRCFGLKGAVPSSGPLSIVILKEIFESGTVGGAKIYMHMFYLSHLDFPTSYCPIAQDPASFLLYVLSSKCEHIVADIDTEFKRIFPVQSRKLAISGILIIKFVGPFAR